MIMDESKFWRIRRNYGLSLKMLRKKAENGGKIRTGFAVMFDSAFPMAPVFETMLGDEFFEPFLIVIPDISRGKKNAVQAQEQTTAKLTAAYGGKADIVAPADLDAMICRGITRRCDLYCTANPYDSTTHPAYGVKHFCELGIPVFFANYGIAMSAWYDREMGDPEVFGYYWRVFCENEHVHNILRHSVPWVDAIYSGYAKMDKLASFAPVKRHRKTVIVAPHHTIGNWEGGVNFGNFLQYQDYFLQMPAIYPDMDFIFRPHPLLFTALARASNYGEKKAEAYLAGMRSHPNVIVQMGGDYLETFVNSDAMIHDCGSFTAEYLFTGKPVCRIMRHGQDIKKEYNPSAMEYIACHDLAYSKTDIDLFIKNVVLDGKDTMAPLRKQIQAKLKKNFPHVCEAIVGNIKEAIKNA